MKHYFPLVVFKSFFFVLGFSRLIMICLSIDSFEFVLFKVHWAFWISKFMSVTKSEKYLPIISSNKIKKNFFWMHHTVS